MFFYREISQVLTDPYFANVALLLRGNGVTETQINTVSITDDSNNNFAITKYGDAKISTSVYKYGNSSLGFDGGGDYFIVADNSQFDFSSGAFTIEAWFLCNSISSGYQTIISKDTYGSNFSWCLRINNNSVQTLTSNISGDWNFTSTGVTINAGTWYHVALVGNGTSMEHYLNGQLVGTKNRTLTNGGAYISIGVTSWNNPADALNGYIDDLRVTKGVARYTSNFTPPTNELTLSGDTHAANVVLLLRGNGITETQVNTISITDDSSNNFAITKYGNAKISTGVYKYGTTSLAFDGDGDYLNTPLNTDFDLGTITSGTNFTAELWIKVSTIQESSLIGHARPGSGGSGIGGWRLHLSNDNRIYFVTSKNAYNVNPWYFIHRTATSAISTNTWHHIALVIQNGIPSIYIDGIYVSQEVFTDGGNSIYATSPIGFDTTKTSFPLTIGASLADSSNSNAEFFHGHIDDLRITKGVARYTTNFTPPSAELPNS